MGTGEKAGYLGLLGAFILGQQALGGNPILAGSSESCPPGPDLNLRNPNFSTPPTRFGYLSGSNVAFAELWPK
jgi:hypothetical protein